MPVFYFCICKSSCKISKLIYGVFVPLIDQFEFVESVARAELLVKLKLQLNEVPPTFFRMVPWEIPSTVNPVRIAKKTK